MTAQVDPNNLMRAAEAHFVAGRFADARPLVEQVLRIAPGHPAVLHLYGLILSRLGLLAEARRALEAAHRGLPGDAQIANNLGNLLSGMDEPESALAAYEAALKVDPRFAAARLQRAVMLDELGRLDEARAELDRLFRLTGPNADLLVARASVERNSGDLRAARDRLDEALALDPAHAVARRGRARIAVDIGEAEAGARHREALAADPGDRDLLLGYLAAADSLAARKDAVARLAAGLSSDPGWLEGHRELAAALWEGGDRDAYAASFERALALRPRDADLWKSYVAAVGKVDDFASAAEIGLRAEAATRDAAFAASAFSYLSAAGQVEEAEVILARLPSGAISPAALAKHHLRRGGPARAEALLAGAIDAAPDDIEAWALRGIAWQMLRDERFSWLNGQPGLVRVIDLPLQPAEIDGIADRLRTAHAPATIRAGQSVRGGTQTGGDLFDRLEPEIALLRKTLAHAIEVYRAALPGADPTHPLLKHRDGPLAFAGTWSIRLTGGGFHVRHMHPRGIVSAASYWALPAPSDTDPKAGWLEIGGAPDYLAIDLPPLSVIEPKVARLVLFPSTLHHGTVPFPAGERISVAFDVTPGQRSYSSRRRS